jgi:hypothetical protein
MRRHTASTKRPQKPTKLTLERLEHTQLYTKQPIRYSRTYEFYTVYRSVGHLRSSVCVAHFPIHRQRDALFNLFLGQKVGMLLVGRRQ